MPALPLYAGGIHIAVIPALLKFAASLLSLFQRVPVLGRYHSKYCIIVPFTGTAAVASTAWVSAAASAVWAGNSGEPYTDVISTIKLNHSDKALIDLLKLLTTLINPPLI
ncbi:hypothetical protein D3C80_1135020 [compost metagenome]